jgi:hypothetical protein
MRHTNLFVLLFALIVFSGPVAIGGDSSVDVDQLLSRHLESIGKPEARAATKDRVVQGSASYRILVGGSGKSEGKGGFVSEGHKVRFMAKLPLVDYRGESIAFNGDSIGVAFANANQTRSPFGTFVFTQDVIVRDGLFAGVLSTSWPLLDLVGRHAKLILDGTRKIGGQQLYQVRYQPAKSTEAKIMLYFDPDSFRHVKTVYVTSVGNNVGATILDSSKLQAERSTLEESFSDFKTFDGLTLPTHWNIEFTRELPNGSTSVSEWDIKADQIKHNVGLDPRNFEIK